MVKPPTFDSNGMKRGAWSKEEDERLRAFVHEYGHNNWRLLPLLAGLARCGKSCRLRWVNYLRPGLKREKFTKEEEDLIIKLHNQLGNKWSAMAAKFPGRTDNEIKNYYHAHIKKRGRREKILNRIKLEAPPSPSPSPSPSSSSSSSSCVTADDHQQESPQNAISPIADLYSFAQARDDLFLMSTNEFTQQECFDFPQFPVEEFRDFDFVFREMQNDASNSSGGSTNFWADNQSFEEDVFDFDLW